jgi:glycosyltransferase involved in cell wall biosynthesis
MAEANLRLLALCTEWLPRHGGLPQFNRRLCVALADLGHDVVCAVERADHDDLTDSSSNGISLVVPTLPGGLPDLRAPVAGEDEFDAVIGHDHRTGPAAAFHARVLARQAVSVQIVHTSPDEIGPFKSDLNWATSAHDRFAQTRELCAVADVVCAVGPRLQRKIGTALDDGYGGRHVVRLDPGLGAGPNGPQRVPGPEHVCLFVGRAQDAEVKGLDIARDAVHGIATRNSGEDVPILWIRGAVPGNLEVAHRDVTSDGGSNRGDVVVRPYTAFEPAVREDLLRASVLLMPSRAEGLGLVGLEAIALGTPALLSGRSGLAELLRELVGRDAENFIVDVLDDHEDAHRWTAALSALLADRRAAYARTERLRKRIAPILTWESTALTLARSVQESRGSAALA